MNYPELEEITPIQLSQYMSNLRTEYKGHRFGGVDASIGPSAIDTYWKCLRSFFGWCARNLDLKRPDLNLPRPRYKLPEVTPFSLEEVKRILHACEWSAEVNRSNARRYRMKRPTAARDKALILLLLDTGLRLGEVTRLNVADMDLQTGEIIVAPFGSGQKTKPRVVYLDQNARRSLWLYLAKRHCDQNDPLFLRKGQTIELIIKTLGKQAQVPKCVTDRVRLYQG
jgi:integrase